MATGCLRNYIIDAKGKEHIVQFAPETWWLADAPNLYAQTPSLYFIDAIENSDLLLIDGPSHQRIVAEVSSYARAFSTGLQRHNSAKARLRRPSAASAKNSRGSNAGSRLSSVFRAIMINRGDAWSLNGESW